MIAKSRHQEKEMKIVEEDDLGLGGLLVPPCEVVARESTAVDPVEPPRWWCLQSSANAL